MTNRFFSGQTDYIEQLNALDGETADHIADTTGAHAATAISNTPAGGIAATTVQAAINELDSEKLSASATTLPSSFVNASLNSITPAGGTLLTTGNFRVDANSASAGVLLTQAGAGNALDINGNVQVQKDNGHLALRRSATNTSVGILYNTGGSDKWFCGMRELGNDSLYWYNYTTGFDRMTLTEAGSLIVTGNITAGSANAPLYNSGMRSSGYESIGSNQFNIEATSGASTFEWVLRVGASMEFYVNNASVVASLTSTGVWTNASDRRLKTNIRPIEYGLKEVLKSKPRSYEHKKTGGTFFGFVAQELKKILPSAVFGGGKTQYTVDYGSLTAVSFRAIQELHDENIALKKRLAKIEKILNI